MVASAHCFVSPGGRGIIGGGRGLGIGAIYLRFVLMVTKNHW